MGYLDRIICPFYEDELEDLILLNCLNKLTRKRNRGNKIKELAIAYLKTQQQDLFNDVKKELEDAGFDVRDISFRSNELKLSYSLTPHDRTDSDTQTEIKQIEDSEADLITKKLESNMGGLR